MNALSELDSPNEYYVDRVKGLVYYYPSTEGDIVNAFVSAADTVVTITGAQYIILQNLIISHGQEHGIMIQKSNDILVQSCQVNGHGNSAIGVSSSTRVAVDGSEIFGIGCKAVDVNCGDVKSLTPGYCRVDTCDIHHFAMWQRTYNPGISTIRYLSKQLFDWYYRYRNLR